MTYILDIKDIHYRELGEKIRAAAVDNKEIALTNVRGHRFIAAGIAGSSRITINGTPGNDLAAYMDGPEIIVKGNAQDGTCNTMNSGTVIVEGDTGDIAGYAMRGGELFVKRNVGYRLGIHMKEYKHKVPVIVIGGKAGDFFGEYMAGGIMIILGLNLMQDEEIVGNYCGTGMHGGVIYARGKIDPNKLGKEVKYVGMEEKDRENLKKYVKRYCRYFGGNAEEILAGEFKKLMPLNKRPYGKLYTPH